ncbi:MAG: hypothetical protein WC489_06530 [Patescibacteria group bacterium]
MSISIRETISHVSLTPGAKAAALGTTLTAAGVLTGCGASQDSVDQLQTGVNAIATTQVLQGDAMIALGQRVDTQGTAISDQVNALGQRVDTQGTAVSGQINAVATGVQNLWDQNACIQNPLQPGCPPTATPTFTPTPDVLPSATPTPGVLASVTPMYQAPTPGETATPDFTPTATAMPVEIPSLTPECILPANWPIHAQEANARLGGGFQDWQLVRKVDAAGNWNGIWDAEAFQMNSWIQYDALSGAHIDTRSGVRTYDHNVIFDRAQGVSWVNVTLTDSNTVMFARRGGDAPAGYDRNVSYNVGTPGVQVAQIEQAALIPVCEICIPEAGVTATDTEAFHNAVKEFTWNRDAQTGVIKIEWFNPLSGKMERINGATISELSVQGVDMSILNEIPAAWMLTPQEMVQQTGNTTKAEWWQPEVVDGKWTGKWVMEAFPIRTDVVRYNAATGLFYDKTTGKLVTDLNKIYNFADWQAAKAQWPKTLTAPHGDAEFFVRTGGASDAQPNTSWFSGDHKGLIVSIAKPGFEQAASIPVCIPDPSTQALQDAQSNVGKPDVNHVFYFDEDTATWVELN